MVRHIEDLGRGRPLLEERRPAEAELDYGEVLRSVAAERARRSSLAPILLALGLVFVPAVIAYALSSARPKLYEASGEVLFEIDRAQFGEAGTIMANAKVSAERPELLEPLAAGPNQPGDDLTTLLERRTVEIVSTDSGVTTTVLRLRIRDVTPQGASDRLAAWTDSYLTTAGLTDADAAERKNLEGIIADLQSRRTEAQAAITAAEKAKNDTSLTGLTTERRAQVVAELDADVAAAGARYDEIVQDLDTQARLLDQLQPDTVQVSARALGEPRVDPDPVAPQPVRSAALGTAVGMVLAATYLFVLYQLRNA